MKKLVSHFCCDEDGAITVDWIVITAAIVALCLALLGTLQTAAVAEAGSWVGN